MAKVFDMTAGANAAPVINMADLLQTVRKFEKLPAYPLRILASQAVIDYLRDHLEPIEVPSFPPMAFCIRGLPVELLDILRPGTYVVDMSDGTFKTGRIEGLEKGKS